MSDIKNICTDVKRMVDKALTWETDEKTLNVIEHWQSHAQRILANENYRTSDDCDGFALTSAELLVHNQIDRGLIRIIFCRIPNEGYHLVCAVDDVDENKTWVLDNNESRVTDWNSINYEWIDYMSYDNLGTWFKI